MEMQSSQFQELIEDSREWLRLSKKRGHDFSSLLVGSYNDPSHFIYEILQNAEDAKDNDTRASYLFFKLYEDKLEVFHNGKDFDFKDIDAIVSIGKSTKQEDVSAIGKFGIGFKSVYAVTKTPYIYSGDFSIKIDEFVVPVPVEKDEHLQGTKFIFPFQHDKRTKDEIFALISETLGNLNLKTLLFLNNIKEIKWETPSKSGHYLKSSEVVEGYPQVKRVFVTSSEDISEEYILIHRPIIIDNKKHTVEVAYRIEKNQDGIEVIVPDKYSKLVVFFSTQQDTYLSFLLQGPYRTTTNRANILLNDVSNLFLIKETSILIAESISIIKQIGYLNIDFLCLLPLRNEHQNELIYTSIFKAIKERLLSDEELLPTKYGHFSKASDALLVRGSPLTELLTQPDIQMLFSKSNWLDTKITSERAKTKDLWEYLIEELKIRKIDFEDFIRVLTPEFLSTKSDEWIIDFYIQLKGQKGLWHQLKKKPFIRLEDNTHFEPFNAEGKRQVYLPTSMPYYKTVKTTIVSNEDVLDFLREFGLTEPDFLAEIKEIILPRYQAKEMVISDEHYYKDIDKIINAYNIIQSNKRNTFLRELSEVPFIKCFNPTTNNVRFMNAKEIYFSDDDLIKYFDNNSNVYFIEQRLLEENENYYDFFKAIGIEDKPRRLPIEVDLSSEEKENLRGVSPFSSTNLIRDYKIDGLSDVLDNIKPEISFVLWKILLKSIRDLGQRELKEFFQGEYSWRYSHADMYAYFPANFLKLLWQKEWLFNNKGAASLPSDIEVSELDATYDTSAPEAQILIKQLKFKPPIEQQFLEILPSSEKQQFIKFKELQKIGNSAGHSIDDIFNTALKLIIAETEKEKAKDKEEKWIPEVEPEDAPSNIENADLEKITLGIFNPQGSDNKSHEETKSGEREQDNEPVEEDKSSKPSQKEMKAIGRWGERYVFETLKREFGKSGYLIDTDSGFRIEGKGELIEVIWLNINSEKGKGCDLIVKKQGIESDFIEVKSTQGNENELVIVTGTQWQFARELFDKGEGDKYVFYRVINTGFPNAKIKVIYNPIQLWKDGKLYAHPIHFKL